MVSERTACNRNRNQNHVKKVKYTLIDETGSIEHISLNMYCDTKLHYPSDYAPRWRYAPLAWFVVHHKTQSKMKKKKTTKRIEKKKTYPRDVICVTTLVRAID